jgi:hypothetical protein
MLLYVLNTDILQYDLGEERKIHLFCVLPYVRIPLMSVNLNFICCPNTEVISRGHFEEYFCNATFYQI